MGWFTHQSKSWELKNSLLLLSVVGVTSILSLGVLTPVAIHIFGSIVNMTKWTKQSLYIALFYFSFLILALFLLLANQEASFVIIFSGISFYLYTIYMSLHLGEYLQRLDLKKLMKLNNNESYSYELTYDQLQPKKTLITSKDLFIDGIEGFKKSISKQSIVNDLDTLQHLARLITQEESRETELFFERHSSTILNVLQQYVEINSSYLQNEHTKELSQKLVNVISKAKEAFENELSNMIEKEVLQVDAENQVYISLLKAKGLV